MPRRRLMLQAFTGMSKAEKAQRNFCQTSPWKIRTTKPAQFCTSPSPPPQWSNATCAMPLCAALSSRRGRAPHHAQKATRGDDYQTSAYSACHVTICDMAALKHAIFLTMIAVIAVIATAVVMWLFAAFFGVAIGLGT